MLCDLLAAEEELISLLTGQKMKAGADQSPERSVRTLNTLVTKQSQLATLR